MQHTKIKIAALLRKWADKLNALPVPVYTVVPKGPTVTRINDNFEPETRELVRFSFRRVISEYDNHRIIAGSRNEGDLMAKRKGMFAYIACQEFDKMARNIMQVETRDNGDVVLTGEIYI